MFQDWENFYIMLGSAAAALIGLLFIVITLTAGRDRSQTLRGQSIYMTPNAVHFSLVLSLSAIALAPAQGGAVQAAMFALGDLAGIGIVIRTVLGIRAITRTAVNPPHWTDMWAYALIPLGIYLALGASVVGLWQGAAWGPKLAGVSMLGLLLIGIRNAWDLITWLAPGSPPMIIPPSDPPPSAPS